MSSDPHEPEQLGTAREYRYHRGDAVGSTAVTGTAVRYLEAQGICVGRRFSRRGTDADAVSDAVDHADRRDWIVRDTKHRRTDHGERGVTPCR